MNDGFVAAPRIDACGGGIFSVDTHYVRPGLDASHIIVSGDEAAFVDTGVSSSVPGLMAALMQLNLRPESVRYVFLTHIHLDHAGGAGQLMQALPEATLVVHPRGARHVAAPDKLIAGAIAVYGEARFKELYGTILPVDADRIESTTDGEHRALGGQQLEVLHTEGHAKHHYCLNYPAAGAVFTGDSFGVSYRVFDSAGGAFVFPTTTPVHFDPDAAHASVDRLVATGARFALLTHYSRVDGLERLANQLHGDLDAFVAMAEDHRDHDDALLRAEMLDYLWARLDAHGATKDAELRRHWLEMDVALNVQGLRHWLGLRG